MKKIFWGTLLLLILLLFLFTAFEREAIYHWVIDSHVSIRFFVLKHPILAPFIYIMISTVTLMLSLPMGVYLGLLSGILFKQPWAFVYALIGASLGCIGLYMIVRKALVPFNLARHSERLRKFEEKFIPDSGFYLLSLRLVPLSPSWLINIGSALLNVPFLTFVWTTVLGIAPEIFIVTQMGVTLGIMIDQTHGIAVKPIFPLETKIALALLACMALVPLVVRHVRK